MKKDESNARETVAHRTAIDAYMVAYVKALKGLPLTSLLGTSHEHVSVMKLSEGFGLECRVKIDFGKKVMTPELVKGFEALRGLLRQGENVDSTKLPPKA